MRTSLVLFLCLALHAARPSTGEADVFGDPDPQTLVQGLPSLGGPPPAVAAPNHVYYSRRVDDNGVPGYDRWALFRVSKATGVSERLLNVVVTDMAVGGDRLYMIEAGSQGVGIPRLMAIDLAAFDGADPGAELDVLVPHAPGAAHLEADADGAYLTMRMDVGLPLKLVHVTTAGVVNPLAQVGPVKDVALKGDFLYWTQDSTINQVGGCGGQGQGGIRKTWKTGWMVFGLKYHEDCPIDLTTDDGNIYWVNGTTKHWSSVRGGPLDDTSSFVISTMKVVPHTVEAAHDSLWIWGTYADQGKLLRFRHGDPQQSTTISTTVAGGAFSDADGVYYFERAGGDTYDLEWIVRE
jgi:hypothetical protein